MHLLVPYASTLSPSCAQALKGLDLPNLRQVLRRFKPTERSSGDEWSLSSPPERVLGRALGWSAADGTLPWAAWQAQQDQIEPLDLAWGLLTPLHWHLGRDHLTVLPPSILNLSRAHSHALFEAAMPLFVSEGWALHWADATRWYVAHQSLATLATASLDRVIGRNPDRWMPDAPEARLIKRLQNEVQMLWYNHPVNDERAAQGLPAVNSLWLSGCGVAQAPALYDVQIDSRLREPLWQGDWSAWVQAWRDLDQQVLPTLLQAAAQGQPVQLTLAGERHAQTWSKRKRSYLDPLRAPFTRVDVAAHLLSL